MGIYTGTNSADTITRNEVSPGVTAYPLNSKPSDAADVISGLAGDDHLDGGGDTAISVAAGNDTINGGAGNDSIEARGGGNVLRGDDGNDAVHVLVTGEVVVGGNDVTNHLYGDGGNDHLAVEYGFPNFDDDPSGDKASGNLYLDGGAGNDTLAVDAPYYWQRLGNDFAGTVPTYLYGGPGDDTIQGTKANYDADGTYGGGVDDHLYGGSGNDTYYLFGSASVVEKPGEGYDTIVARDFLDYSGTYTLPDNIEKLVLAGYGYYQTGADVAGNESDNLIIATSYDDVVDGRGGNDVIYGGYGRDVIHGGSGADLIHGDDQSSGVPSADTLYGDAGNDEIFGLFGDDQIHGGAGDDKLWGQSENDTIYGGDGNDRIGGGSGEDHLYGDAGNDVISGTGGRDWLTGGAGNDRFDWDNVAESTPGAANRDVITDFFGAGTKGGDVIDLSSIDANSGLGGNQAFIFGGTGVGHVRAVASGTSDSLIQADIGGEAGPELEILVSGVAASQWTAGDFIL